MICKFCGYEHSNEGDYYGCPNCEGDGLDEQNPSRTHPPTEGEQQGKGTEAGDCDNP